MVRCNINLESLDDDLIGRVCKLSVPDKEAIGFQIARKGKSSLIETEQYQKSPISQNITEYYISLDLQTIRDIDSDADKQHKFIVDKMPKINKPGTINTVIIRLMLDRNEKVTHQDVEYLWDLLNITGNDIIVPPFFSFSEDYNLNTYMDFVKDFISIEKPSSGEIACAIPAQIPHSGIDPLLKMYEDVGVNSYIIDFDGKKPFNNRSEIQLSKLLREIPKTNDEKYFLYAFDVKPHKQGSDELVAEDMLLSASGFNAVGPRHTVSRKSKDFIEKMKVSDPRAFLKTFSSTDYGYHKITEGEVFEDFENWIPSVSALKKPFDLRGTLTNSQQGKLRILARAYSQRNQFPEIIEVNQKVADQKLRSHLDSKILPREIIPHIDKMKRKIKEV